MKNLIALIIIGLLVMMMPAKAQTYYTSAVYYSSLDKKGNWSINPPKSTSLKIVIENKDIYINNMNQTRLRILDRPLWVDDVTYEWNTIDNSNVMCKYAISKSNDHDFHILSYNNVKIIYVIDH